MNTTVTSTSPGAPTTKAGRGCFFYGCITSIVLFIGLAIGIYFVAKRSIESLVMEYSEASATTLPSVDTSPDTYLALKARVNTFKEGVNTNSQKEPLILSGGDVNTLVSSLPGFEQFRNKFFVEVQGTQLLVRLSFDLGFLGYPDRYLNGSGKLSLSLTNGRLVSFLDTLTIRGTEIPSQILDQFRKENLAKDLDFSKTEFEFVTKLEKIEVKDGKIYLYPAKV